MADHVTLGRQFSEQLNAFARMLESYKRESRQELIRAYRRIGQRARAEAVKRVPVDEGRLKQVLTNTFEDSDGLLVTEVGTNVEYGAFLEFGTEHIAGGKVQALGDGEVTDAQAIHTWPAKRGEATGRTSAMMDTAGGAAGRLRDAGGQFLAGSPQEQLPWLRPAVAKILQWAIDEIDRAMRPPEK